MIPLNSFASPRLPELTLSNFRGLNNRNAATEIDDNESPDLLNIRFNEVGAVSKRMGTALVGDDKGNEKCFGLHSCYYGNGSAELLLASKGFGTAGLGYRTTGNYTEATLNASGTNNGTKLVNTADAEMEDFYCSGDGARAAGQMTFILDGTRYQGYFPSDHKIYTLSTGGTLANPASIGSILRMYKNRMYTVGSTSLPERVYFSALGDGGTFTVGDYFDVPSQSTTQLGTSGDPITVLAVWGDRLIIFKNRSIWAWDNTRLIQISNEHGCVGKRAFASTEYGLFFADNDGVYRLVGGNQIEKISRKIQGTWNVIPAARMPEICMAFFYGRLYVGTAAAGASTNNIILVNYLESPPDAEGQHPWSYWMGTSSNPLAAAQFAVYEASTTTLPILVFGAAHAQTCTIQIGTGDADYDYTAGTSTEDIASYYKTKIFNNFVWLKKLFATYKSAGVSSLLTISVETDFGADGTAKNFEMSIPGSGVYGTMTYGTGTYGGTKSIIGSTMISLRGKFFQYTIQNNQASQPWTLYQIKQVFKKLRLR